MQIAVCQRALAMKSENDLRRIVHKSPYLCNGRARSGSVDRLADTAVEEVVRIRDLPWLRRPRCC